MSGLYNMSKADFDTTLDLTKIKPYGDTMNDGKMQLSLHYRSKMMSAEKKQQDSFAN